MRTAAPGSRPPERLLRVVVRRLETAGLACALGGSGLLAAHGLAETVHDWDLTTDAPWEAVAAALAGLAQEHAGHGGVHRDRKVMLRTEPVEVIVGLACAVPAGTVRIPTVVVARERGIPLGSLEAWAAAYHLLGRSTRAAVVFRHLAARGADARVVRRLLAEPLPPDLAGALVSLPHAGAGS